MKRPTATVALVCLAAAPLAACEAPGYASREITIRHSRFVPEEIRVASGSHVTFTIRNLDPIDHEFLLGDRAFQERHELGTEPHHGARPGEVSIPAGETRTTTYRFRGPGRLLMGCHLPGHWDYGMRGGVIVA
ncbi:MAG TPA: cupredoxin domain-containing protein [Actinomycetota bacterium]|nr:cupredoxin domain-containing protein [Actinomycetota bacterium]